jgi:hypothetical protein
VTVDEIVGFVLGSSVRLGVLVLGVGLGLLAMGLTCVVGTWKGWRWLLDPPREAWFWYSQAFVKVMVGAHVLRVWTYIFGALCIVFGVLNIVGALATLVGHAR